MESWFSKLNIGVKQEMGPQHSSLKRTTAAKSRGTPVTWLEIQEDLGLGQATWLFKGLDSCMTYWCAGERISCLWRGQWQEVYGMALGAHSHIQSLPSPIYFCSPWANDTKAHTQASSTREQLPTITQSKCVFGECHISSPPRVYGGLEPALYDVYIRGFDLGFLVWFTGLCPAGVAKS